VKHPAKTFFLLAFILAFLAWILNMIAVFVPWSWKDVAVYNRWWVPGPGWGCPQVPQLVNCLICPLRCCYRPLSPPFADNASWGRGRFAPRSKPNYSTSNVGVCPPRPVHEPVAELPPDHHPEQTMMMLLFIRCIHLTAPNSLPDFLL